MPIMPKSKKQHEVYTLQRVLTEAIKLIKKYRYRKSNYKLNVLFEIVQQKDNKPVTFFYIRYEAMDAPDLKPGIFAFSRTATLALNQFEVELQKKTIH
jgi:hypothetical protein